jgi:hypothetical protein
MRLDWRGWHSVMPDRCCNSVVARCTCPVRSTTIPKKTLRDPLPYQLAVPSKNVCLLRQYVPKGADLSGIKRLVAVWLAATYQGRQG